MVSYSTRALAVKMISALAIKCKKDSDDGIEDVWINNQASVLGSMSLVTEFSFFRHSRGSLQYVSIRLFLERH